MASDYLEGQQDGDSPPSRTASGPDRLLACGLLAAIAVTASVFVWIVATPEGRGQSGDGLLGPRRADVVVRELSAAGLQVETIDAVVNGDDPSCLRGSGGTPTETSTALRRDPGNTCALARTASEVPFVTATFLHPGHATDVAREEALDPRSVLVCHRYHFTVDPGGTRPAQAAEAVRQIRTSAGSTFNCGRGV